MPAWSTSIWFCSRVVGYNGVKTLLNSYLNSVWNKKKINFKSQLPSLYQCVRVNPVLNGCMCNLKTRFWSLNWFYELIENPNLLYCPISQSFVAETMNSLWQNMHCCNPSRSAKILGISFGQSLTCSPFAVLYYEILENKLSQIALNQMRIHKDFDHIVQ